MASSELDENNVGFRMLKKMAWKEGEGLGKNKSGIVAPIVLEVPDGREGLGRKAREEEVLEQAAKKAKVDVVLMPRKSEGPAEFYCATCDKQYKTVAEFSSHLSSYDHHHRKRFAEMRESQRARQPTDTSQEVARAQAELDRRIQETAGAAAPAPTDVSTNRAAVSFGFSMKKPPPKRSLR